MEEDREWGREELWLTILPAPLTFPRAGTCWTINSMAPANAQRVKWVSPDPNVQPLIIKLMGEQPVVWSLGHHGNPISECLPTRWALSAKSIQLSVKLTGVSWPSASSKFSCRVAQGEYLPQKRHKSTDQLSEEGNVSLAQKQITLSQFTQWPKY